MWAQAWFENTDGTFGRELSPGSFYENTYRTWAAEQDNWYYLDQFVPTPGNKFNSNEYTHLWRLTKLIRRDGKWPEQYRNTINFSATDTTFYTNHHNIPLNNGNYVQLYVETYDRRQYYWDYYYSIYQKTGVNYTVQYDANGGTGDAMTPSTATFNSPFTFSRITFTKTNASFGGWWLYIGSNRQNSDTAYPDRGTFTWNIANSTRTITAKAQWNQIVTITYLPNYGMGTMNKSTTSPGLSFTIQTNKFTRTGYAFKGWSIERGGQVEYSLWPDGETRIWPNSLNQADYNAVAIWEIASYIITYDVNGGIGYMATGKVYYNNIFTFQDINVNGFSVYAWLSCVYKGQSNVANTPSIGDLYFCIADKDSTVNLDIFASGASQDINRDLGDSSGVGTMTTTFYATSSNTLFGTMLLSATEGKEITTTHCQDILFALTSKLKEITTDQNITIKNRSLTDIINKLKIDMNLNYKNVNFYNYTLPDNTSTNLETGGNDMFLLRSFTGNNATYFYLETAGVTYGPVRYTWTTVVDAGYSITHGSLGYSGSSTTTDTRPLTYLIKNNNNTKIQIRKESRINVNNLQTVTNSHVYMGAVTRTGYNFAGWDLYDGNNRHGILTYNARSSITWNIDKNLTAKAQWVLKTSSITYNANGGAGTLATNPQMATYSVSFTFQNNTNNFTKTGYDFKEWHLYEGETAYLGNYAAGASYGNWNKTGTNYTAMAQWTVKTYSIRIDNGGGIGTINNLSATYDSPFTFPSNTPLTKTGYTFSGWHLYKGDSREGTAIYNSTQAYGNWNIDGTDINIRAQWTAKEYTITYSTIEGTGTTYSNKATYGNNFTFNTNTFTRTGYEFSGWYLYDGTTRINPTSTYGPPTYSYGTTWNIDKNLTAQAQWTPREFTVTFDANGKGGANGTGYTKEIKQNYDTTVTCPTIKAIGYVFGGWATTAANAENKIVDKLGGATFTLGTANKHFYAIWTENTNGTRFSELQSVFSRTRPIRISDYRAESGQTTANSVIRLGIHLRGKSSLS
jgi:hypothetical protein